MVIATNVLYNRFKWESIDMKPDDDNNKTNTDNSVSNQQAAAGIIRNQIDNIYVKENNSEQIDDNPYDWTHTEHVDPQVEQWKKYHSAWQNYYQKYYEGYYAQHYANLKTKNSPYFANDQAFKEEKRKIEAKEIVTEEEAIQDLRHNLLNQVTESAKKVRKSRHFIPIASGLLVALIFLFLQYNSFLIANVIAYVSPGSIDVQNIIINPNADITVGPEPRIIIPKINVDAPVTYDIGNDYNSLMDAMSKGLAHFAIPGANSHPGEIGNTVISGHSSNDLFDTGDYKFIFVQLDKLEVGDSIYANYQSKRYTYTVTDKQVVAPNDVNSLVYPTTKPILTLITCTPVGTAQSRLLVIAEQISPDPSKASQTPNSTTKEIESMPGKEPTIIEWLFGQRN